MGVREGNRMSKKKKILLIVLVVFGLVFIIFFSIYAFANPFLQISIQGDKNETIEVNHSYKEQGATANVFGIKLDKKIKTTGKIDTTKLGTYTEKYSITHFFTKKEVSRIVHVVDTTSPVITLKGKNKIEIYKGEKYQEPGYQVTDNYDTNLEEKVKVTNKVDTTKSGTYTITYEVEDISKNKTMITRTVIIKEKPKEKEETSTNKNNNSTIEPTYIKGILIVNKKYALPKSYTKGVDSTALAALKQLQAGAKEAGYDMPLISGYRSYAYQQNLYNQYVARDGQAKADTYSAKPGHSEHQTGLAFDIGKLDSNYGNTPAGKWLASHAREYGFILRYPKGKEKITGYMYEPWHIRYVGKEVATDIFTQNVTLEEYLGLA